jgi:hypothetical protein
VTAPRPPSAAGAAYDLGSMVSLPAPLLAALADCDEVLVTSRAGAGMGTVRMSFATAPPGVVYLLTSAFSRKALRWDRDPWVRLTVPGSRIVAEAAVHRVAADDLDPAAEAAVLARFPDAGAATPEALRELLETGTHLLFRVEGGSSVDASGPAPQPEFGPAATPEA